MAECGRGPILIHPNEWNLKVRNMGSSNHHIFVMLWVDSNNLSRELQASALTTHPLNSLWNVNHTRKVFLKFFINLYITRQKCKFNLLCRGNFLNLFSDLWLAKKFGISLPPWISLQNCYNLYVSYFGQHKYFVEVKNHFAHYQVCSRIKHLSSPKPIKVKKFAIFIKKNI